MSHTAVERQALETARGTVEAKRAATARALTDTAVAEADWREAVRRYPSDAAEVATAKSTFDQKVQAFKSARMEERTSRANAVVALGSWLAVDPGEDVKTLSTDFPVLLFPVRLETRFDPVGAPKELKVRIYPDEILADPHEPWLTQKERQAGEFYWNAYWSTAGMPAEDQETVDGQEWARLLMQYKTGRAAWIVQVTTPDNLNERDTHGSHPSFPKPSTSEFRPQVWTRSVEARALPDRWVVLAYRDGRELHRKVSAPVVEPLALTISPASALENGAAVSADELLRDPDVAWTFDFDESERVGMAVRIVLAPADVAQGFDRIVVIGVKASIDPQSSSSSADSGERRLVELLQAHRLTRGLSFVPQGTPTNNTSGGPSGFPPEDRGGRDSYLVERKGLAVGAETDGHQFMTAIGVEPALAAHVTGSDRHEQRWASAMNDALWPVTLGYFMEQMMASGRRSPDPGVPGPVPILDQGQIEAARRHFVEYVRGRGPYPAFRVGDTPYGLLPTTSLDRWVSGEEQVDPVADLVLLQVQNLTGENSGSHRLGRNLDAQGTINGGWNSPQPIPGGFGDSTHGAGLTIADIDGDGRPDLVVFHIESAGGTSVGRYRIGWGVDVHGRVSRWGETIAVPLDFGSQPEGGGIAVADIDGDGQLDLLILHVEREFITSPSFTGFGPRTKGYYRIGWRLAADGQVDEWSAPIQLPASPFATDRPGAAVTVADVDGDGRLDVMVAQFQEPLHPQAQTSLGYYRIGWELDATGTVTRGWSNPVSFPGGPTGFNQGVGVGVGNLDEDGRPELVVFRVDKPGPGETWKGACEVAWNLDATGNPTANQSDPATTWSSVSVPGDFRDTQGVGLAVSTITSGGWETFLRSLRDLCKSGAPQVPHLHRGGADPDGDLLHVLGMDASARELRVRSVVGGDVLLNLYHYRGTQFFGIDWATWSKQQQQILEGVLGILGEPAWDVRGRRARWNPRVGEMVMQVNPPLFRFPFVTSDPLSEEGLLPRIQAGTASFRNYIDWVLRAPIASGGTDLRSGLSQMVEDPLLLYLLLRHGMLHEYASAAFAILLDPAVGLATEHDRREPELVGLVPGASANPTVWDRFAQPLQAIPALSGFGATTLGEYLSEPQFRGGPGTERLESIRMSLETLMGLPTAELERLVTETLDVCSHRVDAWITSLATRRLRQLRRTQPLGSHIGAFGWVEDIRPAPPGRFTSKTVDGRTVLVQQGSGGRIHAPSMTHATSAAILRNAHLTRAGAERKRYAVDLSSKRVRTARRLLDAVREGQPLGEVLGYVFERGLHERQLEKYLDPLRDSFPLVPVKDSGGARTALTSARSVVNGLSIHRREKPFDDLIDPTAAPPGPISEADKAALEAEAGELAEILDSTADLLTAESVFQAVRGNTAATVASLDAMAQGLRPPDPDIARSPRGGSTLTHRVAVILGLPAPSVGPGWPDATPRAEAEPHLDAWVGSLLGDPRNVKCRASYLDPSAAGSQPAVPLKDVTLASLGLRPLDVLALAKASQESPQASELDQRVAYAALRQQGGAPAGAGRESVRISYAPDPGWDRTKIRTFPELLEVARVVNSVISGARSIRPEDLLPPEAAGQAGGAAWSVGDGSSSDVVARAEGARTALQEAKNDLDDAIAPTSGNPKSSDLREALRKASLLGLPSAVPMTGKGSGTALRESLLAQARDAQSDLARRLESAKGIEPATGSDVRSKIGQSADLAQAVFGRDFALLPAFKPAEPAPGELDRALAGGPLLIQGTAADREEEILRWFQGAARVRPSLERWRRLALYEDALGAASTSLELMQLPYSEGDRWAGLPFSSEEQRPPAGRVSVVMHREAKPASDDNWVGLFIDEWTEVIPNKAELTGIAFHYDRPAAEAPQVVLLAVPPGQEDAWDLDTLVSILHETLDLAKVRGVDGDMLGALGQFLPAIHLAANTANDAVSTDFRFFRREDGRVIQ